MIFFHTSFNSICYCQDIYEHHNLPFFSGIILHQKMFKFKTTKAIPTIFINKLFSLNCFPPIKSQGSKQIRKSLEVILWYCISNYKLVIIILYLLRHFLVSDLYLIWSNLFVLLVWKISLIFWNILFNFIVWWSLAEQFVSRCNLPIVTRNSDSNCYVINSPHYTLHTHCQPLNSTIQWQKKFDKLWHQRVGLPPSC